MSITDAACRRLMGMEVASEFYGAPQRYILGACAFCKMLAVRGAVYERDTANFRAHDGCHCGVVPIFRG
ncbi:hypothetical protein KBZ21_42380, partial [Streptomyces sp. A73]|nr:hypothetical protein [Streptomyces sp. A73]MBQ1164627.1 hypothetical protein [Streptomyces sp. A73]